MKCINCGMQNPDSSAYCSRCGNKLPVNTANLNDFIVRNFSFGNIPVNLFQWDIVIANRIFDNLEQHVKGGFDKLFDSLTADFDGIFSKSIPGLASVIMDLLKYSHLLLCSNKATRMSEDEYVDDMLGILDLDSKLADFYEGYDKLSDYVNQLNTARSVKRASRGRWQGGGFGISGAIKGAIKAGMLNIGTDFIYSIGDSITNSRDKSEIQRLKCLSYNKLRPVITIPSIYMDCVDMVVFSVVDLFARNYRNADFTPPLYYGSPKDYGTLLVESGNAYKVVKNNTNPDTVLSYVGSLLARLGVCPFDTHIYLEFLDALNINVDDIEYVLGTLHWSYPFDVRLAIRAIEMENEPENIFSSLTQKQQKSILDTMKNMMRSDELKYDEDFKKLYWRRQELYEQNMRQ